MTEPFRSPEAPLDTPSSGHAQNEGSTREAVAQTAKDEAGAVTQSAKEAGQRVSETARSEASDVAAHAKDQLRGLTSSARDELRGRAWDTHSFATSNVRSLSDELRQVLNGEQTDGPVNQAAQTLASRGESLAGWLEQHDPEDVVDEVRRFAARRPVAFLAIAAGAGLLAGRLARGAKDAQAAETERAEAKNYYAQRRAALAGPVGGVHTTGGVLTTPVADPGPSDPFAPGAGGTRDGLGGELR